MPAKQAVPEVKSHRIQIKTLIEENTLSTGSVKFLL
jgi:hypothetical protein